MTIASPFDTGGGLQLPFPSNTINSASEFPPLSQRANYMFFAGADFTDPDTLQNLLAGHTYYWLIPDELWVDFIPTFGLTHGIGFICDITNTLVSQTIVTASVAQPIQGLDLLLEPVSSNFSVVQTNVGQPDNESKLIYDGTITKSFLIDYSAKLDGTATDLIAIGLFFNGSAILGTFALLQEISDFYIERTFAISLSLNDELKLGVLNNTSTGSIDITNPALLATQIGASISS